MKKFLLENGRPDKPMACPRCNSLNTKFCYFNNYNVKQPRHFCRECQRYWTAGGSLRNVPVGAGRRKHKISSSRSFGDTPTSSEVDECSYISSVKPYPSLPFKQLVAGGPDGIVQETQSFKEIQHDDVMSMYGSQTVQELTMDEALDSKFSLARNSSSLTSTHYDTHAAEKLGFWQMTQKRARDFTLDTKPSKVKHVHVPGNPSFTSTHDKAHGGAHDDAHHEMHDGAHEDVHHGIIVSAKKDVHGDAEGKDAHASYGHELPPSYHATTQDLPVSCHMAEHDDSTCCSSVTAALASSSSEGVSETNGSSPTTHTLTSVTKPMGLENQPAIWGPLMWPWLWPFFLNRGNGAPGMSHVDPTLALGLGAVASAVAPQVDSALTSTIQPESVSNASHVDHAYSPAVGPSFLHWPYVWNPLAWGSTWNVAWNGTSITGMGNQHFQDPVKEKQGSLCVPKTLRMDHPNEASYSSILSTLGVATLPHSPAGFFNAFQPKADVFQPKMAAPLAPVEHLELQERSSPPHVNPAAQARSVAFQEGS